MPPVERSLPSASCAAQEYDLSLCVSLLAMLDFRGERKVTREDWKRGTRAMALHAMGEDDALWRKLLDRFDPSREGVIDLRGIEDLIPMDPRVTLLLKARTSQAHQTHTRTESALCGQPIPSKLHAPYGLCGRRCSPRWQR